MLEKIYSLIKSKLFLDKKELENIKKTLQKELLLADVDINHIFEINKTIEESYKKYSSANLIKSEILEEALKEALMKIIPKKFELKITPPMKILLIGLYGSGKTTTAAKLANLIKKRGFKVALSSLDKERPAAKEQLQQLAAKVNVPYIEEEKVKENTNYDVIILDSPGKNALDEKMIEELKKIKVEFKPTLTFLVIAADIGQNAYNYINKIKKEVGVESIIITKFEGRGKAGSILSAASINKIPISFIGTGEKIEQIEEYNKEKVIKKLLGEEIKTEILEKISKKIKNENKHKKINLQQIKEILNDNDYITSIQSIMPEIPKDVMMQGEENIKKLKAIIDSMTPYERNNPEIILQQKSRIIRISKGSGVKETEVKKLIKHLLKSQKIFKKLSKKRGVLDNIKNIFQRGWFN